MTAQKEYNVLRQNIRHLHIRIDIINERDIVVSSFEGIATSGDINLSATSTYRRSGTLSMIFDKKYNILPSPTSKIWFNKRCGIHIGLTNYADEIIWFNMGRFAIQDIEVNLSAAEKTLSCTLADYMCFLDGTLGGKLSHKTVIPAEEATVSQAIIAVCSGLVLYSIEDIQVRGSTAPVPYTIEKEPGSTAYELIEELVNLYMDYDFYFNEKGYFVVEKITNTASHPVTERFDDHSEGLSLDYSTKIEFTNVKNSVYVWGMQLDQGVDIGKKIQYAFRNRWSRELYSDLLSITDDKKSGDICHIISENNSYAWLNGDWELLDFKVVPIFNIENIGEKITTFNDDNIFTTAQARLRAEYELRQFSNFAETVSFNTVPLYNLMVNDKISINIEEVIEGDYLIQEIGVPLDISSSMNITASKIYY